MSFKYRLKKIIYVLQQPILLISYYTNSFLSKKNIKYDWIIGVDETAKFIYLLKCVFPNSCTVSFSKNKYYNLTYNYSINETNKYFMYIFRTLVGPILLGYLMNKSNKFWYIAATGFLIDREYEFKFLKSKNKTIVCMFLGSEIRAPRLMMDLYKELQIDGFIEYLNSSNSYFLSDKCDEDKRNVARVADLYADIIFSAETDQKSYLQSKQIFPSYFYNQKDFHYDSTKFNTKHKIKILHAPSNPFIKGTPLVRAAIKKLQMENYNFDYIELQNTPNEVVIKHLKTAHIVLNQFYAFVPGVFGIEAMANNCAVLMSADSSIETGLHQDSKDAWMITRYWEVYDNLKYLLDNPQKIKYYADKGYEFTYKHYTCEAAGLYIDKVLKDNGVID